MPAAAAYFKSNHRPEHPRRPDRLTGHHASSRCRFGAQALQRRSISTRSRDLMPCYPFHVVISHDAIIMPSRTYGRHEGKGCIVPAIQWDTLALPWQCCLEEAWTAYCMGSVPIGAAITDRHGQVVARGRNRIFEETAPGEAIVWASFGACRGECPDCAGDGSQTDPRTLILYTTTEPCPLCIGAIRVTRLGEVRYAARDSAAGSITLLEATPYMRRGGLRVVGPMEPEFEAIVVALHVEFSLRTDQFTQSPWLLETWQATVPAGVALGRELFLSGRLQQWRAPPRLDSAGHPGADRHRPLVTPNRERRELEWVPRLLDAD